MRCKFQSLLSGAMKIHQITIHQIDFLRNLLFFKSLFFVSNNDIFTGFTIRQITKPIQGLLYC